MPALHRSCASCISAKRRCDLAIPRCKRCIAKKIRCQYRNEPAKNATLSHTSSCPALKPCPVEGSVGHLGHQSCLSKSMFETSSRVPVLGLPCLGYRVPIPYVFRSFSPTSIRRQMEILQASLVSFARAGATPFFHPSLYHSQLPPPLDNAKQICKSHLLKKEEEEQEATIGSCETVQSKLGQMLRRASRTTSFSELVLHVQATTFLQIICLLEGSYDSQEERDCNNEIFLNLALLLYDQAPRNPPEELSPWASWVFAESVRRLIIICHIILAIDSVLTRGYSAHLLCFEALPFDMRPEAWSADNAHDWEAATKGSPESSLVCLRQLVQTKKADESSSLFEEILLLNFQ